MKVTGTEPAAVSTFRPGISRWLGLDVANRLKRTVDTPVTHVVAAED